MNQNWKALEQKIAAAVKIEKRPVAVAFLEQEPAGIERFAGTEPSGCSYWRLAAAGRSFYTLPENHFNCAVGAYTHNLPLSAEREKETEQTFKMMFDLGYVKPEELPAIPRLATTPKAIAYSALGEAEFAPDVVLFACKPAGAMLLNEAAGRAGIGGGTSPLGRPTCMALPASQLTGSVVSLGCIGNRVYTGLGDDELYFVVRGKDLEKLVDALALIRSANEELREYAGARRTELASV